jgi:hypothetical protein
MIIILFKKVDVVANEREDQILNLKKLRKKLIFAKHKLYLNLVESVRDYLRNFFKIKLKIFSLK